MLEMWSENNKNKELEMKRQEHGEKYRIARGIAEEVFDPPSLSLPPHTHTHTHHLDLELPYCNCPVCEAFFTISIIVLLQQICVKENNYKCKFSLFDLLEKMKGSLF